MITTSLGIKQFQTQLPALARKITEVGGHYLITNRGKPAFMAIPFEDYQEIEDIVAEMNSKGLLKDIEEGRKEYDQGKTVKLEDAMKKFSND